MLKKEKKALFQYLLENKDELIQDPMILIGDFNTGLIKMTLWKGFVHMDLFNSLISRNLIDIWRKEIQCQKNIVGNINIQEMNLE